MTTTNEPLGGEKCQHCDGEGSIHTGVEEAPTTLCTKCDGTGIESYHDHGAAQFGEAAIEPIKCGDCDGFGRPQAGAAGASEVKTWQERTSIPMPEPHEMLFSMRQIHAAKDAEIADLRSQLARQQAPVGDSVDTPEFRFLLTDVAAAYNSGSNVVKRETALIAHINAWKDAQLARERQGSGEPVYQIPTTVGTWYDVKRELYEQSDASARRVLYTTPAAQAQGEPVAWEYRHYDQDNEPYQWSDWERVKPRGYGTETIANRVAEIQQYIANGYKYELRALYAGPAPQADEVRDAARYRFLEQQCRAGSYRGIISREAIDEAMRTTAADNQKGSDQ